MKKSTASVLVALIVAMKALSAGPVDSPPREVELVLRSGAHERRDAVVHAIVPDAFSAEIRRSLAAGPTALTLRSGDRTIIAEARRASDRDGVELVWVHPGTIPAGAEARLTLDTATPADTRSPWSFRNDPNGGVDLARGERKVFRYNSAPVLEAGWPEIQRRDAYIHPVYTPSGLLATGDFSKFHTHHRGIFLAYAKMKLKDDVVDVWNIHNAKAGGKIHHEKFVGPTAGPVTARFSTRHRWETKEKRPFLDETWDVEVYDVPGSPYWLFDITSTQIARETPVELSPYRYGGMAYRGPEPFVKGKLDVLTSEGRGRVDGDQKPARWVDLTGPSAEGSNEYLGAMIADHPSNINHPTVARIHPTSLPFFSYVPSHQTHNKAFTLAPGEPRRFRYRVLVHDGRPDRDRDERVWRDFAEPVEVAVIPPRP
ncbi:MAG: PmoA family protein [Isosphaeraceae bacterium]|nr:PmoA family protein [Isosphaeraceae bacterium]